MTVYTLCCCYCSIELPVPNNDLVFGAGIDDLEYMGAVEYGKSRGWQQDDDDDMVCPECIEEDE